MKLRETFGMIGLALFGSLIIGFRQAPVPDNQPPVPDSCPVEQLLAYFTMGGLGANIPMHSVLVRDDIGWSEWVAQYVQPKLDEGYRRVMIHLPFGKYDGDPFMSFDSYIHAQQLDLDLLWKDFAKALRPVVKGKYTDGDPVQVICYLGSLHHDPDFVKLLEQSTTRDQWLSRVWRSTRVILDAGCELAFDTAGTWQPDSPGYSFVTTIKNRGAGGWIEGTEHERRPDEQPWRWRDPETNEWHYWNPELIEFDGHWRGFPVVANHQHFWANIMKTGHPSAQFDSIEHYGDVILMLNGHSAPRNEDGTRRSLREIRDTVPEWMPPMVRRDVEAGYSVAVAAHFTSVHNLSPEQLLGCP